MQNKRKLPIGVQDFEKLREDGCLYVDKTDLIYSLAHGGGSVYFLSRPRRFGKSLLISTMHEYFAGKRELFAGLKIAALEKDWIQYPVIRFDFTGANYREEDALEQKLSQMLCRYEEMYGRTDADGTSVSLRFNSLIRNAAEKAGERVVILVDEYDKSLLETEGELNDKNRALFKGFFGNLKGMDGYIKFAFFTGVTKFSKVSIFSDLNQLRDISLEKDYASICGITQAELEANFGPEIDALAQENGITYAECVNRLREMYDGYKFHGNGEPLYNPFSVMNAFASREFGSYWFRTGTPTILIKKLEQTKYDVRKLSLDDVRISAAEMSDYRPDSQNPIPLFYQTGYLTIKRYDAEYRKYLLGYPNEEVKYAFLESLVPMLTDGLELDADFSIVDFNEAVKAGDTDTMRDWFTALFAKLPYMAAGGEKLDAVIEQNFENVIYIVFILLGQYAQVEQHSVFRRADCIVQNKNCVYIFEFKRDDTAENALKQIEEKKYTEQFAGDKRRLFKIGVSFSTKERGIAEWKAIEG